MKFDDIFYTAIEANIDDNHIPMLLGEPGIGKSSFIDGLAKRWRTECFVFACNQLADKADVTGARLVPTDDGSYKQMFYPHAVISEAVKYAETHKGETPILFFDEINRTTPDVTSELLSIPTNRSIGDTKLPNNLCIICAGNDKGNVISLDSASVNRFVLYRIEPDLDTFFAVNPELNPIVKATLTAHPDTLFCKTLVIDASDDDSQTASIDDSFDDDDDGMQQFTSPRSITAVSDWLNHFDDDQLLNLYGTSSFNPDYDSVLQEIIEGHVGHTSFAVNLMAEIANSCSRHTNQSNPLHVSKPACWDDLAKLETTSVSEVEEAIGKLNEKDISGCIVYALYDKTDHAFLLEMLIAQCKQLMPDDMKTLMLLLTHNKLFVPNVESFLALPADKYPFVNAYRVILDSVVD